MHQNAVNFPFIYSFIHSFRSFILVISHFHKHFVKRQKTLKKEQLIIIRVRKRKLKQSQKLKGIKKTFFKRYIKAFPLYNRKKIRINAYEFFVSKKKLPLPPVKQKFKSKNA